MEMENLLQKKKRYLNDKKSGFSVTVAWNASSVKEWFDSTAPLKISIIPPSIAMKFRKRYIRGFVHPGGCNCYIGAFTGNLLFGVLGFSNPDYGKYDLLLKADTTPSEWEKSTDLLLFCMRTSEVKKTLERKFCREINTIYSMCFTLNESVQRYKKHGKLKNKTIIGDGFNLGYEFEAGSICSLKEAKAQFIQKSWKR